MAEEKKFKNLRKTKMSAFTRKHNMLLGLVDISRDTEEFKEALDELQRAFESVESAHDEYVSVVDEAVLDEEGDYLSAPSSTLGTLKTRVKARIKDLIETKKTGIAKAKF